MVGRSASLPFTHFAVRARAAKAWAAENEERAKREQPPLVTIGLHELRHSHVSQMDAAGFSLEEIGDYVGHSSAWMTDRYRHLLAGHEAEAAERFEAYLTRARESGKPQKDVQRRVSSKTPTCWMSTRRGRRFGAPFGCVACSSSYEVRGLGLQHPRPASSHLRRRC